MSQRFEKPCLLHEMNLYQRFKKNAYSDLILSEMNCLDLEKRSYYFLISFDLTQSHKCLHSKMNCHYKNFNFLFANYDLTFKRSFFSSFQSYNSSTHSHYYFFYPFICQLHYFFFDFPLLSSYFAIPLIDYQIQDIFSYFHSFPNLPWNL